MTVARISHLLSQHHFSCSDESQFQAGIEQVLVGAGIKFVREFRLSPSDRVDFMVDDGLAVEAKVQGSFSEVIRQLHRYAQHPEVREVLLVTTRSQHRHMPTAMSGKPVHVVHLVSI